MSESTPSQTMADHNASQHFEFHLNLLKANFNRLLKLPPFNNISREDAELDSSDQDFLEQMVSLIKKLQDHDPEALFLGQECILRLIRSYPHITHLVDRDILWFFGGDCLHYMPDEEIEKFQRLDDLRFEADSQNKAFDIADTRAKVFNLN